MNAGKLITKCSACSVVAREAVFQNDGGLVNVLLPTPAGAG